jgi:hypothetical protein
VNRRTKVLFAIVIAVAAGFVIDKLVTSLWWEPWKKTRDDIADVDKSLARVIRTMRDEDKVRKEWKEVRNLLDRPRTPDVQNHFLEHLRQICEKVGATLNFTSGQPGRQGDFKEYVVDFKLQLTLEKFVSLVEELHNSREFLKLVRLNILSKYDKEDLMDLDLRVSTIEFDPAAQRAGAK